MLLMKQWKKLRLRMDKKLMSEMLMMKVLKMKILIMEMIPKQRSVLSLKMLN